jgi:hypothetical protein
VLPAVLACTLQPLAARADISTWTDASGRINVSNLAPPEGARVSDVVRERAPEQKAPRSDAARNAAREAEVQALEERVRQLQDEVELATRRAAAPVRYRAFPEPPPARYGVAFAPPPVQYASDAAPTANPGCDAWTGCGLGWFPGLYPASVVVLRAPGIRRFHPAHGGQHVFARLPTRMPGGLRRR